VTSELRAEPGEAWGPDEGQAVHPALCILLFGWLAGFYIVPEGLAAPYARSLHGNARTVGLLMAAVPLGMVIGAFVISRITAPSARIRMMGWLAALSYAPLIGSAWNPPGPGG
jgi:predicted MFS family arabinose efflux permease